MVNISRRFEEGKSTKKSFKNLRYDPEKTVSNHMKRLKSGSVFFSKINPGIKQ